MHASTLEWFFDFSCPWSYCSLPGLAVLAADGVALRWRAWPLHPGLPEGGGDAGPLSDLARWQREEETISAFCAAMDLPWAGRRRLYPTERAHAFMKWGVAQGADPWALASEIFRAVLGEGRDPGCLAVLGGIAAGAGLPVTGLSDALADPEWRAQVADDQYVAGLHGVGATPAFLLAGGLRTGFRTLPQIQSFWAGCA